MALLTDEIREECQTIPAEIVRPWDFALETGGDGGSPVKEANAEHFVLCDGTVIESESVSYTFYQNPAHEQEFANKA